VTIKEIFTLSEAEARRLRRGAFLPIVLILPVALIFGLEQGKPQPMHFLMTFAVATGIGAVVASIGWYGAQRRIDEFSRTRLTIEPGKIVWTIGTRRTELNLNEVKQIDVLKIRGTVRSIILYRAGATRTILEGYGRMNDLLERLCQYSDAEVKHTSRWLGF
jgi:hypothetical protein